jgi:hypothetical protein
MHAAAGFIATAGWRVLHSAILLLRPFHLFDNGCDLRFKLPLDAAIAKQVRADAEADDLLNANAQSFAWRVTTTPNRRTDGRPH